MITRTKALLLRKMIEKAVASLADDDALDCIELFEHWTTEKAYVIGDRTYYEGNLYKVLIDHTSHEAYPPDVTVSLYARMLVPDPTIIPDWEQPISTNAYMMGDKVRHVGKVWISTIDYNVYEPGVYGWDEVI
jgi:chitodextrinase